MKRSPKVLAIAGCFVGVIAATPGYALVISKTNSGEEVIDGGDATKPVMFSDADRGGAVNSIVDVNITIDFMKCSDNTTLLTTPLPANCLDLDDAYANEIKFILTSPLGTSITLVDFNTYFPLDVGPTPGSRIQVTFDDSVPPASGIVGGAAGDDFSSGTFQPIGLLSTFNGEGAVGTWELSVFDSVGTSPLGFASYTLDITLQDAPTAGAPVPGTALLLAAGLGGLFGFRRRIG